MEQIKYLNNNQINRWKWDSCINNSINRKVYALSWYLDIVANNWSALVYGDYELVFPIIFKKILIFKKIYHPLFCQQLGPFSMNSDLLNNNHILTSILNTIDGDYKKFHFSINSYSQSKFKYIIDDCKLNVNYINRVNLELDLKFHYQKLFFNYNLNTKRNLKKSSNFDFEIKEMQDINLFVDSYQKSIGPKSNLKSSHYKTIKTLIETCIKKQTASLTGLYDDSGNLVAGIFWLNSFERDILLFNFSNKSMKMNAMTVLIDQYIKANSLLNKVLDFEGSNILSLQTFYKGFGALENNYIHILK